MRPASSLIVAALHCGSPVSVKLQCDTSGIPYFTAGMPSPRIAIIRFFSGFFLPGSM